MKTNCLKITIPGRPFTKKNSRQIFYRYGKLYNLPSEAYLKFQKESLDYLEKIGYIKVGGVTEKEQPIYVSKIGSFSKKVFINYVFYLRGLGNQDGDNIQAGINDILEDAGFLTNDRIMREWHGKIIEGADDWKTEVEILEYES